MFPSLRERARTVPEAGESAAGAFKFKSDCYCDPDARKALYRAQSPKSEIFLPA
jgi:hypothetical protein